MVYKLIKTTLYPVIVAVFLTSNSNNRLIEYDKIGPESHIVLLSCGNKGYCLINRNAIDNFK